MTEGEYLPAAFVVPPLRPSHPAMLTCNPLHLLWPVRRVEVIDRRIEHASECVELLLHDRVAVEPYRPVPRQRRSDRLDVDLYAAAQSLSAEPGRELVPSDSSKTRLDFHLEDLFVGSLGWVGGELVPGRRVSVLDKEATPVFGQFRFVPRYLSMDESSHTAAASCHVVVCCVMCSVFRDFRGAVSEDDIVSASDDGSHGKSSDE